MISCCNSFVVQLSLGKAIKMYWILISSIVWMMLMPRDPKFEDKGEFYYNMEIYYNDFAPNTFKILGFINDKVIVGSYKRSKEDYIQSFIINDIEEIEKL